ncbi:hypothetical protein THIX_60908 [Thiomonas sp. X19]|nr:hypothetical protein THIX_60908 [Thiomonas sp. X19]
MSEFGQRGPLVAPRELVRVHVALGIEEIRIDQRREQHAHPQRKAVLAPGNRPQIRLEVACVEQFGRRVRSQRLRQLRTAVGTCETHFQSTEPIRQPGMMPGDEIGQHPPRRAEAIRREHCACRRMRCLARLALDVGIGFEAAGLTDVTLETGAVFAQVVPLARQPCRVGTKGFRETGSQISNRRQMISKTVRFKPVAVGILRGMGNGLLSTVPLIPAF